MLGISLFVLRLWMDKLLSMIVNLTDELFSFVDRNYCYQEVNNAYLKFFNRTKEEYIGTHIAKIMGLVQFLEIKSFMDRCFSGEMVTYERWFDFKYGKRYYLIVSYTPYKSENEILGVIVSVKNYTQQKLLEEKQIHDKEMLLHYAKMAELGSMASFLNHQWRLPLNSLGSNLLKLKLLADVHGSETPLHHCILRCEDILEQISDDLECFREFYNPNTAIEQLDVEEMLSQVLLFLDERLQSCDVATSVRGSKKVELRCRKSDFLHLMMIFFNNILDAFERRKIQNAMIDIHLKNRHDKILLMIEDNAGGVEKDILEKLFTSFASTKAYKEGSGMGLFFGKIVAKEKLGARIFLKNGKAGLRVVLEIPK